MFNDLVKEAFLKKLAEEGWGPIGKTVVGAGIGGAIGAGVPAYLAHQKFNKGLLGLLMPKSISSGIVKNVAKKGGLAGLAIGGAAALGTHFLSNRNQA